MLGPWHAAARHTGRPASRHAGRTRRPAGRRMACVALLPLLASLATGGCAASGGGDEPVESWATSASAPTPTPVPSASAQVGIGSAATSAPPTKRPTPTPTATPGRNRYAFPVRARNVDYHPTHSGYPGTDLFAACGEPVVAVTDGTILEVSRVDQYDEDGPQGPYNGGKSVSLLGDDGVRYYGSHFTDVAGGLAPGVRVRAGQSIATVGRTGNANNVCHVHFGISPPCKRTGDWWIRRGVVWPAPFLDAWRKGVNRLPAATVTAWHRTHGCPAAP